MSVYQKFGGGKVDYLTKSNLYNARPSQYAQNGTGRDTYIG
jgi:hypothetical protein